MLSGKNLEIAIDARHKAAEPEEMRMPNDPMTLMGFGIGAIVVIWLVFSVVKKLVGVAIVLALAAGGWFLYTNPAYLNEIIAWVRQYTG